MIRWLRSCRRFRRCSDPTADWALARLPEEHPAVLDHARAIYIGAEDNQWDDLTSRIGPHADYVVREIDRLAAERS